MQYQYETPWIMANYLLLRNNKESGPYSLDDLMELGLKAYDLVWVQGRSAAWRYPSEVEELKPFAPAVEEQPFDRFYKKQNTEQKEQVIKEETPVIAPEHEKYVPKKSVFVTLPGQKTSAAKPAVKEQTYTRPVPTPVQQTISVMENPVAAQVKYSQPLDEIKEMYVKTLQDRKQKIARKSFWIQALKKAAVILLLIAVGVIAGLVIKSNGNSKQEIARQDKPAVTQQPVAEPVINVPETNAVQQAPVNIRPSTIEKLIEPSGVTEANIPSRQPSTILKDKPVSNPAKNETALSFSPKEKQNPIPPQGVETNPATGERSRKLREESAGNATGSSSPARPAQYTGELANQVSVTSNEYKKVAFGGIRNLELTINNDSKYALDNVIVELAYLKPSEEPLKTDNVVFKSVGPKSTSTIRIPDTNRGIKVTYRIINIKSRQMDEVASGN